MQRKPSWRRLGPLALALAAACPALPAWSLDLAQAYQAALEQDATLRAARAGADARRERLPQARSQLLPNIALSASQFQNRLESTQPNVLGESTTTEDRYTSSNQTLTLRQPLLRPALRADYRQAQAQVAEANALLERETQSLAVRVSGAYFEALLAADQLGLVLAQKTSISAQLDAAQKRLAAGAGTRTDIDEARAAFDLNLAQELEARQNVDFTRRQISRLINRDVDQLAAIDPQRLPLLQPDPVGVELWIRRAEENSPEIQALQAQLEAARHEVSKAKAGHLPTLDAIAQLSRSNSDNVTRLNSRYHQRALGLQLNVPLFSGGAVNSQVRQALAEQLRVEESLEALRRDLGVRLHTEYRGVTEGVLRVRALEQAVRSAEQVVISNRRSFEAGSRTLLDTLNAEQQRVSALRDLAQARYVYLVSRVRLLALAGGPKTEVIDQINGWLVR